MSDQNVLIANRAELLAQVALTRSPALTVYQLNVGGEAEIDFLCSIGSRKVPTFRTFGAMVWGTAAPLETPEEVARQSRARRGKLKKRTQYFFPVIILLATMHDDQVFCSWLVEPAKDSAQLVNVDDLDFHSFNSAHYESVIRRVTNWYAHLSGTLFPDTTRLIDLRSEFDDEWE